MGCFSEGQPFILARGLIGPRHLLATTRRVSGLTGDTDLWEGPKPQAFQHSLHLALSGSTLVGLLRLPFRITGTPDHWDSYLAVSPAPSPRPERNEAMGRLWARRKSLSLRELSQGQAFDFVGFFRVNAAKRRTHAARRAARKDRAQDTRSLGGDPRWYLLISAEGVSVYIGVQFGTESKPPQMMGIQTPKTTSEQPQMIRVQTL